MIEEIGENEYMIGEQIYSSIGSMLIIANRNTNMTI